MRRGRLRAVSLLVLFALLSGCSLLPKEKQRPQAPLLEQGQQASYTYVTVSRGTVTLRCETKAVYSAARSEQLQFADPSLPLEAVLVQLGDEVQAGQLLAAQESEELEQTLADQQTQQELLLLRQTYLERVRTLDAQRSALDSSASVSDAALQLELLALELQTLQTQLAQTQQQLEQRRLAAGLDGVVTAVSANRTAFTISDLDSCLLTIAPENAADFAPGTEVFVQVAGESCPGVVCGAQEVQQPEDGSVYVLLSAPALLSSSSNYTVYYVAQQAEDTLYIPEEALRSVDGNSCVYLLDADGLPQTQQVETGLVGGGSVEILSGLEEGQRVILEQQ